MHKRPWLPELVAFRWPSGGQMRYGHKDIDIKVDFVYGREEALKVIAASQKDYENHFGHLHLKDD